MPAIAGVKETCLYVDDLDRAKRFYTDLFELRTLFEDARFCAIDVSGAGVLLLFLRGASLNGAETGGGLIPPHDGAGPVHIGFGIESPDLPAWEARLEARGIAVESRVQWPRGGQSVYFRDPDNHLLELLTRGTWPIY